MIIQDTNEFISLLNKGYSNEQLAKYFNCGVTTIKRFKKNNGLIGYKTNAKPLSIKEIQNIEALVSKGMSLQQICEKLGKSDYILKKYVSSELYNRIIINSRDAFTANLIKADITNIFIPNEYSAYICGLLQSDGCLTRDGCIKFVSKDVDLANSFARFFKTVPRKTIINTRTYYVCSFKDVKNLEKFKNVTNILPSKTYSSYIIPDWIKNNDSFMFHFIAGVFDGDGWVSKIDNTRLELGIEQHVLASKFLQEINNYLGWSEYDYSKYAHNKQSFRIATKSTEKVLKFYTWYSKIEFIMLRKVSVLDEVLL